MQINIKLSCKLVLSILVAWPLMAEVSKITGLQNLCNIFRKKWVMNLIFCILMNIKSFLQIDTIFFDGFGQVCPKYPNKFAISLQYLKSDLKNVFNFFPIIFTVVARHAKSTQNYNYLQDYLVSWYVHNMDVHRPLSNGNNLCISIKNYCKWSDLVL